MMTAPPSGEYMSLSGGITVCEEGKGEKINHISYGAYCTGKLMDGRRGRMEEGRFNQSNRDPVNL